MNKNLILNITSSSIIAVNCLMLLKNLCTYARVDDQAVLPDGFQYSDKNAHDLAQLKKRGIIHGSVIHALSLACATSALCINNFTKSSVGCIITLSLSAALMPFALAAERHSLIQLS